MYYIFPFSPLYRPKAFSIWVTFPHPAEAPSLPLSIFTPLRDSIRDFIANITSTVAPVSPAYWFYRFTAITPTGVADLLFLPFFEPRIDSATARRIMKPANDAPTRRKNGPTALE